MSCASSTWSLPSLVRARWAKMSRISAVRSMTRTSRARVRFRSCPGDSESSEIRSPAPRARASVPHLLHLALPEVEARVPLAALLDDAGEDFRAGAFGQASQLLHRLLDLPALLTREPEAHEDRPIDCSSARATRWPRVVENMRLFNDFLDRWRARPRHRRAAFPPTRPPAPARTTSTGASRSAGCRASCVARAASRSTASSATGTRCR